MKAIPRSMSLERWILVLSLAASVALAVTGWTLRARRVELEEALVVRVPKLATDLLVNAQRYSKLHKEADREGIKGGQSDPMSYVRGIAGDSRVAIGSVDPTPQQPQELVKGVLDRKYTLRPQDRNKGYRRENVSRFMWFLEQQSRRVRVTHVLLDREQKNLKPDEIGNDQWTWEIEITSRQKKEEAAR